MVHPLPRTLGLGLTLLLAGPAWAQPATAAQAAGADPADARASVPALVWRSTFTQPDAIRLPPALAWKEANDQVQRIGGWRAYARQATEPDAPAAEPVPPAAGAAAPTAGAAPATPPTPRPGAGPGSHGGHHGPHKP